MYAKCWLGCLLIALPLLAQGEITRGATTSSCTTSASLSTSCDISHTVDANTTLLVLCVQMEAIETISGTPAWNTSENLTLINATTASGSGMDMRTYAYALVDPTETSATLSVSTTQTDNISAFAVNYLGTDTTDVATATNFIDEDVNDSTEETNTTETNSGGSSGNALVFCGAMKGGDAEPASNNAGFAELFDDATGIDVSTDHGYYMADLLSGAPSGIQVTWSVTDSNAGQTIELVKEAVAPGNSVLFYTR